PPLCRHSVGVLEDPDLVEVAVVGLGQPGGGRPPLAAEDVLVQRPSAAAGAIEDVHQRVPADAWSASAWSRRKRSSANGAISSGARPVAICSAIASPPAGIALKPQVPQPVVIRNPSTPVSPMIGLKSAEMSHSPAQLRRIRIERRNGRTIAILYA